MPKRPIQHIIGEKAARRLADAFPEEWTMSALTPDYAKDFLVEIVRGGINSGVIFIVQLKGTNALRRKGANVVAPIKREHLHYYAHSLQLPVMIALVDVVTGEAFFDFPDDPQEQPKRSRESKRLPVSVDLLIPESQKVSDHTLLEAAINRAIEKTRAKYPGPPLAAVEARRNQLRLLDPRFDYDITISETGEHVTMRPKSGPISFTTTFEGHANVVRDRVREFIQTGAPLIADEMLTISVDGLPAFGTKAVRIETMPHGSFEFHLQMQSQDGSTFAALPPYMCNAIGGTHEQRIEWQAPGCPISGLVRVAFEEAEKCLRFDLTWKWNPEAWTGKPILTLPWFDAIYRFLQVGSSDRAKLVIRLTTQGNLLAEQVIDDLRSFQKLLNCLHFLDTMKTVRSICEKVPVRCLMPEKLTDADFNDIDELDQLITTGRLEYRRQDIGMTVAGPAIFDRLRQLQVSGYKGDFKIAGQRGAIYNFLGESFDFDDYEMHLSDWESLDIVAIENRPDAVRLSFRKCALTRLWPRFVRAT